MNRTKRFLGGVFFGYAQQILVVLTGLWLTPFLLHRIGQHDYGLWLVGLQILTWLTLMDLGIVALLPRETAYAFGRVKSVSDATELPIVIAKTLRVVLLQWPIVGCIALLSLRFFTPASTNLRGPISVVIAAFLIVFPMRIFHAVLEGLQDLHFLGRIQILWWAVGVAVTVILVIAGLQLYALAIGWATTQLLFACSCFGRLKFKFPTVMPSIKLTRNTRPLSSQFSSGLWVSVAQISQVLLDATDLFVVGKTLGTKAVVTYSCTDKLVGVLSNQPTVLMHAASPGLSALKSGGDSRQAFQVALNLTQAMLIISGLVICIVLSVNHGFVVWWVGPQQFAGFAVSTLLAVSMLLRHWNTSTVYSIFCFGHERRISITTLADGLLSVSASFLLVHRFGLVGAPLGSILGVCLISLPFNLRALSEESHSSLLSVISPLLPWVWRFIPLAMGSVLLSRIWTPSMPLEIGLTAISIGAIYAVVMFPMFMSSPLHVYLPRKIIDGWNKITRHRSKEMCETGP